jgi:hypothetical protein
MTNQTHTNRRNFLPLTMMGGAAAAVVTWVGAARGSRRQPGLARRRSRGGGVDGDRFRQCRQLVWKTKARQA